MTKVTARSVGIATSATLTAAASRAAVQLAQAAARSGMQAAPKHVRTLAVDSELLKLPAQH
ncbi:hypothetical protein [Xanthomonas fragariae]|uniref:hypothetical protein n=1 Tax=Xanthomonas fragariae TaxID=48664 RepID=UPI003531588F